MSHFTAVLDANVLHSQPLTSLLLELAVARLYRPAWSQDIHAEWRRSVLRARPDPIDRDATRRSDIGQQADQHPTTYPRRSATRLPPSRPS